MDNWERIKTEVDAIKQSRDHENLAKVHSGCEEGETPWYHKESIVTLSLGGCTPDGRLIKTIGMSRKDLPKQKY